MPLTREQIQEEKRRLKEEYGRLFDDTSALLYRHDPIHLNFGGNTDEYDPEARTILPRLRSCHCAEDVTRVVHEEFVHWFGAETAGTLDVYGLIGRELWSLWSGRSAT